MLTLLALAGQLTAGATLPPEVRPAREPRSAIEAIKALSTLCGGGSHAQPGHAPSRRHGADCALCPLCIAWAMPGAVLAPAPILPRRSPAIVARPMPPSAARAPPAAARLARYPTGPPALA